LKIVISGASGFLGQEVSNALSFEHDVLEYPNLNRTLIEPDMLERFDDCDYFIHLAEPALEIFYTPEFCHLAGKNTELLSKFFREKLLYASSVLTYGLGEPVAHVEHARLEPFNNYTHHKVKTEEMVYRNKSRVVRISNVIGPSMNNRNLINNLIRKIRNSEEIIINSDDSRDFIDVRDAGIQIANILDEPFGQVINVGSGNAFTISEVASELARQLVLPAKINQNSTKTTEPKSCLPDITLLKLTNPDFRYTTFAETISRIINTEKVS
jgi:nucleoside-diphosphate-sugar epimerase